MTEPSADREPSDDALTRMVRDGVVAKTMREKLELAGAKLTGEVPLGVDAQSKAVRKALAGGAELLALIKYGFLGSFCLLIGIAMLWFGFQPLNWQMLGIGAVLTSLGAWAIGAARRARANLRSIRRA